MEWISVKDRLPTGRERGWYLVCIKGWVTEAWWTGTQWEGFTTCTARSNQVTHWMPLPERPKEAQHEP